MSVPSAMTGNKTVSEIVSKADSPANLALLGVSLFAGAYLAYTATRPSAPTSQALQRVRHTLGDAREEVSELAQRTVDDARHTGSGLARQALTEVVDAGQTLQDQFLQHTGRRQSAGISSNLKRSLAVVSATLLTAKLLSSYMRWSSENSARKPGEHQRLKAAIDDQSGSAEEVSSAETLQEHTVVELRKMASDQDIDGRSTMLKSDLVEALSDEVVNDPGSAGLKTED